MLYTPPIKMWGCVCPPLEYGFCDCLTNRIREVTQILRDWKVYFLFLGTLILGIQLPCCAQGTLRGHV